MTSFTIPYLLKAPYADLGAKVGFIYGSLCVVMVVVAFFCIPEMKGRSLEEVDQLFESGEPLRKFGRVKTRPVDDGIQTHGVDDGGDIGKDTGIVVLNERDE